MSINKMNVGRIIKSLSWSQLIRLLGIAISRPILFYCFIKATKKCISITTTHFGNTHHKNNIANAFRHALWTFLIINFSLKAGKNIKKSTSWAKFITDWHEDTFINNPLERAMDIHNNTVGICFAEKQYSSNKNLEMSITSLLDNTNEAIQITNLDEIKLANNKLVFIDT